MLLLDFVSRQHKSLNWRSIRTGLYEQWGIGSSRYELRNIQQQRHYSSSKQGHFYHNNITRSDVVAWNTSARLNFVG